MAGDLILAAILLPEGRKPTKKLKCGKEGGKLK
jgi:hypothetical protein